MSLFTRTRDQVDMERATFRSKNSQVARSFTVAEDRRKACSMEPQGNTKMSPMRKISAFALPTYQSSSISKKPNQVGSFFGETINKSISEDSDSFHNSDEVQTFDSKELEELKLKKNVLNDSIFKTKRFLTPIERKYQKEKKMQRQ